MSPVCVVRNCSLLLTARACPANANQDLLLTAQFAGPLLAPSAVWPGSRSIISALQAYRNLAQLARPTFLVPQDEDLLQQACEEVKAAFREEIDAAFPPSAEPGASLKRPLDSDGEPALSLKMLSRTPQLNSVNS